MTNGRILTTVVASVSLFVFVVLSETAAADSGRGSIAVPGTPIADVIDVYRKRGYKLAYSTSLLTDDVVVKQTPTADTPIEIISEVLRPYDLKIDQVEGVWVVHEALDVDQHVEAVSSESSESAAPMPELTVSASRYQLLRNIVVPGTFIDQDQFEKMPVLGDDPFRAAQTLPGIAASGVSAKSYIRGGESRDTGIVLNGNALLEPYHVRNFQSLFSAIDARAVDGIEVFSGNYPARFGNSMGGVMVIDTIEPPAEGRTELGLSVFNASVLSSGTVADGKLGWLVSARRGNLDQVIDDEYGEPSYGDFLGQLSASLSDNTTISFNALVADDKIILVTESKPSEPEASTNMARTAQFWINWQQQWSVSLSSLTTASINEFTNDRIEFTNDPEEIVAALDDDRSLRILRLNQHWTVRPRESEHLFEFGFNLDSLDSSYDYIGTAEYFGVYSLVEGLPPSIQRDSDLQIAGQSFGAYVSTDFALNDTTVAQLGIRWDGQNYGNLDKTSQLSPRLSIAHSLSKATEIRASIGRFYQPQGIHELQVEDGVEDFFSAQRTDVAIVGLQHRYPAGLSLRAEAYWKYGDRVRPRFENILNQITVLPEYKPDRTRIAPSSFRSMGMELSLRRAYKTGLTWWATYVLSSADDKVDGSYVPRSWDQRHAIRLGLSATKKRWDFGVVATAHSGWPHSVVQLDTTDPTAPVIRITDRNLRNYQYFATIDFQIRYTQPVRVGKLTYFFEISNALNRKNECCIDFDADISIPNQPVLELETKYWLPLIPAIGVLWQF